jgi:hypothetical protein
MPLDIKTLRRNPGDQMFTHFDPATGAQTCFAVTLIREHTSRLGDQYIFSAPIEPRMAKMILMNRGIERPRLKRAIRTTYYDPLLYLEMPDGSHLLADGSHTYVAMFYKGITWAKSFVVPPSIWNQFTISGLPAWESEEHLLQSFSGDPAND